MTALLAASTVAVRILCAVVFLCAVAVAGAVLVDTLRVPTRVDRRVGGDRPCVSRRSPSRRGSAVTHADSTVTGTTVSTRV